MVIKPREMNMFPFSYKFDRSFDVYFETYKYISDKKLNERLFKLFLCYHKIGTVIPQTNENFWSGHYFPWMESWSELEISYNLMEIGLYKQSFYCLRSSFELGLLSVYWNLNDDGHIVMKDWLKSEVNTPRFNEVWQKLEKHKNFITFQNNYDLKKRLSDLGYLHYYVHSKGSQHSNTLGKFKSNFQTFEAFGFDEWMKSFEEIVKVLSIIHLIKYPIGTVKFDFRNKFGIDIPSFGGLDIGDVELLEEIIGADIFPIFDVIAKEDGRVIEVMEWINSLEDMTEQQKLEQVIDSDKRWIEQMGFEEWEKMENQLYKEMVESDEHKEKVKKLKVWAVENNFMIPKYERLKI